MPRSQRTQLTKSPFAEAKLGDLSSEPLRAVDMPLVTPEKSSGQALAEAVGVVAEAGVKIFKIQSDKENKALAKATAAEHKIQGLNDGKNRAAADLKKIRETYPLTEQNDQIFKHLKVYFEELKDTGLSISTEYFSANVSAYRDSLDSEDGKIRTAITKDVQADNKAKAALAITTQFESGASAAEIITTNKNGPWDGTSIQKLDMYVEQAASYALAMQQINPKFDVEGFIKKYLEIKAPNNGPDLLKNASTGDKIRRLRADLTAEGNTIYSKHKKVWKEGATLLETQKVTPTEYNAHIDMGEKTGVYSPTKAETLKLKYLEKSMKLNLTKTVKALNDNEQAIVAKLKTDSTYGAQNGKIYVTKDVKSILVAYENNLMLQVASGDMTNDEAKLKITTTVNEVVERQAHLTYQGNFDIREDNAGDYATLPPKTKSWVKNQVRDALADQEALSYIIPIATANPEAAKPYVSTLFPYTTDVDKINKALKYFDSLKDFEGGYDMFNSLPSKQKVFYESLDAIRDLDGKPEISDVEADKLTQMIEAVGDTRDFRVKIRDKHKDVTNLKKSIEGLPDSLQSEMLVIYDYFTQIMSPKHAVHRLLNKIRPKYFKEWDRPGTGVLGSDLSTDTITAINWGAFKHGGNVSPVHIAQRFSKRDQHVPGDIRVSYDDKTDVFTIGTDNQIDMYKATYAELAR